MYHMIITKISSSNSCIVRISHRYKFKVFPKLLVISNRDTFKTVGYLIINYISSFILIKINIIIHNVKYSSISKFYWIYMNTENNFRCMHYFRNGDMLWTFRFLLSIFQLKPCFNMIT